MATRSVFNDLLNFQRNFDALLDNMFRGFTGSNRPWTNQWSQTSPAQLTAGSSAFWPPAEVYAQGDNFELRVFLPGLEQSDISVSSVGNQLTVRGERRPMGNVKNEEYFLHEIPYGTFERTFTLPQGCKVDAVSASFHNGVLTLTVPGASQVLPKRIPIQAGKEQPKLEKAAA